jgi:hypothetical protein
MENTQKNIATETPVAAEQEPTNHHFEPQGMVIFPLGHGIGVPLAQAVAPMGGAVVTPRKI